ncbi:hypothetical protein [Mycolicibacterium novocastrense]|uniref:Uncharacterized protein n=1 Tax=Mycolicibacterium novocastrense TaxID=59813 RepID=A0ABQ0KG89_MYCNV|nr:hypothetical protein [Mycolicibacterium novocastrense]GAT08567.1 putative uncharacterized protein [Mycolicibacterium novocastrense]
MRRVLLIVTAIAAAATVAVWRSRHGIEVWHAAPDAPPANQGP